MYDKKQWLDSRQFEYEYPYSRRTFFQWIRDGKIAAYRPSAHKTLVRRSDVEKLLEASRADLDLDALVEETLAAFKGTK